MPEAAAPKLSLNFYFACQGLPSSPLEWAATPIAPAPAHPTTGRQPVVPSSPLPWPNLHMTIDSLIAIVSRVYQHPTPGPFLDEDAGDLVWEYLNKDRALEPVTHAEPAEWEIALAEQEEAEAEAAANYLSTEAPATTSRPMGLLDFFPQQDRQRMQYHVEMWIDLSTAERLADPAKLRGETNRLHECVTVFGRAQDLRQSCIGSSGTGRSAWCLQVLPSSLKPPPGCKVCRARRSRQRTLRLRRSELLAPSSFDGC